MSELDARNLLKSAEEFVRNQRAQRDLESQPTFKREGSHVTVGQSKPLANDWIVSYEKDR